MPWKPSYSPEAAAEAIAFARTWREALEALGLAPHGKNVRTLRKWAALWEIPVEHLPAYRPGRTTPRFSEAEAREAIAGARSWAEALRRLDYAPSGGNPETLRKWARRWSIPTDHFYPRGAHPVDRRRKALSEILAEGSTYTRTNLKRRLYDEGLKHPRCELCGQGELWRGKRISLILDHINGVRNDNRLENLRIVCPNCAATLETHCGRKHPGRLTARSCDRCGVEYQPRYRAQRYCSRDCASKAPRGAGIPRPERRKVERPPYEQLLAEIEATSYLAVARKYGVSDNAIRKWVRWYERQREREARRSDPEPPARLDEAA